MGAMYLHMQECSVHYLIPIALKAPIFTVITEIWPCANQVMVTNNLTVIIEVVLIKVVLIEGFPQ